MTMRTGATSMQEEVAPREEQPVSIQVESGVDLTSPHLYINRELSWIEFNRRVLEEAMDARHPLLERVKFFSIFCSNLDEFFMIRVSGLKEQLEAGIAEAAPDGLTVSEQISGIRAALKPLT